MAWCSFIPAHDNFRNLFTSHLEANDSSEGILDPFAFFGSAFVILIVALRTKIHKSYAKKQGISLFVPLFL